MLPMFDSLFLPVLREKNVRLRINIPFQRWGEGGGFTFSRRTFESRDHLFLSDNLSLLHFFHDNSIDLAYIDPPFATGKYRGSPRGDDGPNGFDDSWTDIDSFIGWLKPRLTEIWRVLSCNGSLVIHLDSRAIHHIRIFCDDAFGADRWENEIIWHYTGGGRSKSRFSRKHDVLLWYSKGNRRIFNIDAIREPYKPTSGYAKGGIVSKKGRKYMPHPEGTPVDDVWDIPIVNPMSGERTAYPTQKPLALMERIVSALSGPDSIVADFFSGSGTTALACRSLGRRFICCDNNPDAIGVTVARLHEQYPEKKPPALISHGFYRLRPDSEGSRDDLVHDFLREVFSTVNVDGVKSVSPSWVKDKTTPYPLGTTDIIIKPN